MALGSARGDAQDDPALRRTVVVSVWTQEGRLVNGLTPEFFAARFHGQPVKIESATYDNTPHRVMLVLDTSASMGAYRGAEISMAIYVMALISPSDLLGLLTFGPQVRSRVPLSTDRTPVQEKLKDLQRLPSTPPPGSEFTGKTALWDALAEALDEFGMPQPGDTVCLISDGGDNGQHENARAVRRRYASAGVRIFTLGLIPEGLSRHRVPEEVEGPQILIELGHETGGGLIVFDGDAFDALSRFYGSKHQELAEKELALLLAPAGLVARLINGFYRLEIRLPVPVDKPRGWKLWLVDPKTGKSDHLLEIRYPNRLFPVGSPSQN